MRILLLSLIFITFVFSNENFDKYLKLSNDKFIEYQNKENILWADFLKSTKTAWVEYDKSKTVRSIVDFKKQEIIIDVISKKNNKHDIVSKINSRLNKVIYKELNGKKVISDVLSKNEKLKIKSKVKINNLTKNRFNDGLIRYRLKVELPPDYIVRKAALYEVVISKYSNLYKIDKSLIYSIIHSESSFNPLSESSVAYGLMQIVPKTAGLDVTKFLYGKEKLVSKSFLFNAENSILFGTTYLYLLKTKYFEKISLKKSKQYCMIAAYNTGPTNLLNTFSKNKAIAFIKLNTLSTIKVKEFLIRRLPYNETKVYLIRVTNRIPKYGELIRLKKL